MTIGNQDATSSSRAISEQGSVAGGERGIGEEIAHRHVPMMGGPEEAIAAALLRLEEAGERSEEVERRARESQLQQAHDSLDQRRAAARKNKMAGIASGVISAVTSALGTVGESMGSGPQEGVTAGQRGLADAREHLETTRGVIESVMVGNAEEQRLDGERLDLLSQQDALRAQQADETGDAIESSSDRARQALSRIAEIRAAAEGAAIRGL